MSPTQLVIAVFLFLIGFLAMRWALQRGPAQQVDDRAGGRPLRAGFVRGRMPAGFARARAGE